MFTFIYIELDSKREEYNMKKPLKKLVTLGLIIVIITGAFISINNLNRASSAKAMEAVQGGDLLGFLQDAYNVYWNIEDSIDYSDIKIYKGREYVKVEENFHSIGDIDRYLDKFYTKAAKDKFMSELSPRMINGQLYVIIGEAGDQPSMTSGEIVDMNLNKGYATMMVKDRGGQNIYIKAMVKMENEKLKVDSWQIL